MRALEKVDLNNVVFIDIETVPQVKELKLDTPLFNSWAYKKRNDNLSNDEIIAAYSKEAGLYPEFAKVAVISVGRIVGEGIAIKSYADHNEHKLLEEFNEDLNLVVSNNRKTRFCGHAAIGFDVPFIFKRMLINGIQSCGILDNSGKKPWEVDILDTKDLWRGTSFSPSSLINIAIAFGLPSPKDDIDGSQVGTVYWSGDENALERITKYCEGDVLTTANVLRKMMLLPALERTEAPAESEEKVSLIEALNNGAKFGTKEKGELEVLVLDPANSVTQTLTMLDILDAVAAKKTTKLTKVFVKSLRDKIAQDELA